MRRDSDAIVVPCGAHETNKLPWIGWMWRFVSVTCEHHVHV